MAVKELKTRIALKYDSYSAWTEGAGKDLVLLKGELGICEIPVANAASNVAPTVLFKVGNGTSKFSALPWASAKAADVYGWAKASDVVYDSAAKTITFVGGNGVDAEGNKLDKVFTLNYVTKAEVEAITNPIAADVAALKAALGEDGTTGKAIEDIKDRLDVIEGDAETEGSIAKAVAGAVATAAGDATSKANTAEANAKSHADGLNSAMNTRVSGLETLTASHTTSIADNAAAIGQVRTDFAAADLEINNKIGTLPTGEGAYTTVVAGIEAAKQAGIDAAAGVQSNLDTLSGTVGGHATTIGQHSTDIAGIKEDITDLQGVDEDFEDRIARMEAFFEGAAEDEGEGESLKNALDTLKEIQEFATSEGTAAQSMLDSINANAQAITAIQDIVKDGGTLEARVDQVETKAAGNASAIESLQTLTGGFTGTIKAAVEAAASAASVADGKAAAAQGAADAAQADATDAQNRVKAVEDRLNGTDGIDAKIAKNTSDIAAIVSSIDNEGGYADRIEALEGIVVDGDDANSKLRSDITDLQTLTGDASKGNEALYNEISRVAGIVEDANTGLAKTKEVADGAASLAGTNATKIAAIESDYLKAADEYIFNCGTSTTIVHVVPTAPAE